MDPPLYRHYVFVGANAADNNSAASLNLCGLAEDASVNESIMCTGIGQIRRHWLAVDDKLRRIKCQEEHSRAAHASHVAQRHVASIEILGTPAWCSCLCFGLRRCSRFEALLGSAGRRYIRIAKTSCAMMILVRPDDLGFLQKISCDPKNARKNIACAATTFYHVHGALLHTYRFYEPLLMVRLPVLG